MSITLTQLRSFLAVMRTGSVTGAADELVVTQPSVSAAVTALSREVGTALLEREGRGVRPTAAGAAFAPFATDVIGLLERGTSTALEAAALSARELNIAAVTTAAESFVPALIRSFSEAHAGVGLTLSVGNREGVFAMVADHTADVAFVGRPPRDERIESWPVRINELVLIGAPDDPFVGAGPMPPADLDGRAWLLREPGSGTRTANEEFLADARSGRADADAGLQRRDQAGRARRPGHLVRLPRRGRGRARGRPRRGDRRGGRPGAAPLAHAPPRRRARAPAGGRVRRLASRGPERRVAADAHAAFAEAAAQDGIVLAPQAYDWLCEQGHVGLERVAKVGAVAIVKPVIAALATLTRIYTALAATSPC